MIERDPLTADGEAPDPTNPKRLAELQELTRIIARGFDAEAFMDSDMGRFIRARANEELHQAQDALVAVDAGDVKAIRELQLQARVAERVLTYFGDMTAEAKAAEQQHAVLYDAANQPD